MTEAVSEQELIRHWERLDFHRAYVADVARNACYWDALSRHAAGRSVVDVGSGTGLLAMMAAKADAESVVGLEWSSLAETAERAVADNGLSDKVAILRTDARDYSPERRADVVVHDLIGSFVWDEGLLEVMAHVRERVLAPTGKILPSRVELHVAPMEWPERGRRERFWSEPRCGLDLSAFGRRERGFAPADGPTVIHLADDQCLLASPASAALVDLELGGGFPGSIELKFTATRVGEFDAVLGFMKIAFDDEIALSTKPGDGITSWGQIAIPLREPLRVREGDALALRLKPALRSRSWEARAEVV